MFNEDQIAHMEFITQLPLEQRCYCGWNEKGHCFSSSCDSTKTRAEYFAEHKHQEPTENFPTPPMSTDNQQPGDSDARGVPLPWKEGDPDPPIFRPDDVPAEPRETVDDARLNNEELKIVIDMVDSGNMTHLAFLVDQASADRMRIHMQAKVDAAEVRSDLRRGQVVAYKGELEQLRTALEAAQAVSAEFLQSRIGCLKRLDAAQTTITRLTEALEWLARYLPDFCNEGRIHIQKTLAAKESQDAGPHTGK